MGGWSVSQGNEYRRDRSKETGMQNTVSNNSFNTNATFRPEGQATLDSLAGFYGNAGRTAGQANSFYQGNLGNTGVNPYAQGVVDAQSKVADTNFKNRLAMVRSGGFRGGAGRDVINQGNFATNFTNQQQELNQRTLLDAYEKAQAERFASAQGLSQNQNAAQSFLALLRGEQGASTSDSTTNYLKYLKNEGYTGTLSGKFGMGTG